VWQALTESEHMRYWMPCDLVGRKENGAILQVVFWPDIVESKGLAPDVGAATIEVWDPPRTFEWIWNGTRLADKVLLLVYPILLGTGKRFFSDGAPPRELALVGTTFASSGVVISTYRPSGPLRTGSFDDAAR
jgi:hypothetical protein